MDWSSPELLDIWEHLFKVFQIQLNPFIAVFQELSEV
jgi:hypothetical protein